MSITSRKESCEEIIEGQIEGKRVVEKLCLMQLEDIKVNETYVKINRRALKREYGRNWVQKTCPGTEHRRG